VFLDKDRTMDNVHKRNICPEEILVITECMEPKKKDETVNFSEIFGAVLLRIQHHNRLEVRSCFGEIA
jgi:hypothetical protein